MDLTPFKNLIKEKCGLTFENVRSRNLASGIGKRMALIGICSSNEYLACLMSDGNEFNSLVNLVTINETYFFREPAQFSILAEKVIPEMMSCRKPNKKISILSAGCSTGEEPYSLVMAVMEKYGPEAGNFISVTGTDIDDDALEKAKKGIFSTYSFRGMAEDIRNKYFTPCGNNLYAIKESVRNIVEFRKMNLFGDAGPRGPLGIEGRDVIFYRNVSIYFDPETQKNVLAKLAGIMNDKGVLFVGSTEIMSHDIGILSLVEMDGRYFFRKSGQNSQVNDAGPRPVPEPCVPCPAAGRMACDGRKAANIERRERERTKVSSFENKQSSLFKEAFSLAKAGKYTEALELIDSMPAGDPAFIGACILKACLLMNMKKPAEAKNACLKGIECDKWCPEAHLLLGMIARSGGDNETAQKRFKEALYIDSSIWQAHYYLGEIYKAFGDAGKACREYEIVIRLLRKSGDENRGLVFFPLSVPAEQMEHICKDNIARLRKAVNSKQ